MAAPSHIGSRGVGKKNYGNNIFFIVEPDVVTPGRFELPTCGLGNRRSIHLSYGANPGICTFLGA